MRSETKSEYVCPNCGYEYEINDSGDHIQPCPNCGSQEIVKNLNEER